MYQKCYKNVISDYEDNMEIDDVDQDRRICTNYIHFLIGEDIEVENQSIISTTYHAHRHEQFKNRKKRTSW